MLLQQRRIQVDPAELLSETLAVKRCALVVKGGRRFSFSAFVVSGNENGLIGLGHGKAKEVSSSIEKAGKDARKRLIPVERHGSTIPHRVVGKFGASRILLMPAAPGTGVIACTPVRALMQVAGIHDILTKSFGSNNPVNLVKATIAGLVRFRGRATVYNLRGVRL